VLRTLFTYGGRVDPANAVVTAVATVVSLLTLADIFGLSSIGPETFSRVVVFLICASLIAAVPLRNRLRELAEPRSPEPVRQIPADAIKDGLEHALAATNRWVSRGGSGRWLRQKALPALRTAAGVQSRAPSHRRLIPV